MTEELKRCFRLLEIETNASSEEAKQAYHVLVKVWHPDRFANDPKLHSKAQERLKEINRAYEVLREFYRNGSGEQSESNHDSSEQSKRTESKDYFYLCYQHYAGTDGVKKNLAEAARWATKSAELGVAEAQYFLGRLYLNGEGVSADKTQAVQWLTKAAEQGYAEAQFTLGCLYNSGFGANPVEKGLATIGWESKDCKIEAYKWLLLSFCNGKLDAWNALTRVGIWLQKDINEARARAARFFPSYPPRTARDILHEWLNFFLDEIRGNKQYAAFYRQTLGDLETFDNLPRDIIENSYEVLQSELSNNHPEQTKRWFQDAGSFWKRKLTDRASRTDVVRIISGKMLYDKGGLSLEYLRKKENALNQIWMVIGGRS